MKKKQNKNYQKIHKKLKKLGISSGRTKKNYSTNEKRQLSRTYNRFKVEADGAENPFTNKRGVKMTFTSRELKTRREIELAKGAGYQVYKNKIIIKHDTRETVRVKRAKTVLSGIDKVLQIELKKGMVRRDLQIAEKHNILSYLENQSERHLPRGVKATVKVGKDNPFMTSGAISTSYKMLLNYISNWEPKDSSVKNMTKKEAEKLRLDLIGQMTLVYIN